MNVAEAIEQVAGDEAVDGVILWYPDHGGEPEQYTWSEARPYLDFDFDPEWTPGLVVWSESKIIGFWRDGDELGLTSIPRHP